MDPLVWAGLLLLLGLVLVVCEVLIPSGGMLGFVSFAAIVCAIAMAFYYHGPIAGFVFIAVTVLAVPVQLALAFKVLPHTAIGKKLLVGVPTSEEVMPDSEQRRQLRDLIGKVGVVQTVMLPSGLVQVAGMSIDALSAGLPLDPGVRVRVIEVRGQRVVVQPVDKSVPLTQPGELAGKTSGDVTHPQHDLSQPLESLGLNPSEDPLA